MYKIKRKWAENAVHFREQIQRQGKKVNMKKMAILMSKGKANWASCRKISNNLLQAYKLAFSNTRIKLYDYNNSLRKDQTDILAREIISYDPDSLVHICDRKHIHGLLDAMERSFAESLSQKRRPSLFIHVYGNLTLNLGKWFYSEELLQKYKTIFICASEKQKKVMAKLIDTPERYLKKYPFPVNEEEFYYDPQKRAIARKKIGIKRRTNGLSLCGKNKLSKKYIIVAERLFFLFKKKRDLTPNCIWREFSMISENPF